MDLLQRSHSVQHPHHHQRSSSSTSPATANDRTVVSALLSDNLQSPNAIPPRTSSSGAAQLNGTGPSSSFGNTDTNGERTLKPSKRASTSVLRPISERDWLSQGKRFSQDLLGRNRQERDKDKRKTTSGVPPLPPSSPPKMDAVLQDTLPGANREQQQLGDAAPSSPPKHQHNRPLSPPSGATVHRAQMVDVAPQRKSSRHKPSSSLESNGGGVGSSRASAAQASQRSPLSPPPPPEKLLSLTDDLIHQRRQQPWSADKERTLLGPYAYLLGHPGKDIRAQLIAAFNEWLKVPEQSLAVITRVIGMLHTASLLVDDVEDSSQLRRGVPVAHSIFGTAQTINSANYVYFLALQELTSLPSSTHAIQIYTSELINLHRGQGLDLFWRDTLTCPTEADYLEMVNNKTGGLFRLAVRLMQAESRGTSEVDCVALVNTIGLLFQILDDHLNLSSSLYTARKGLCEDLTEGKFSFPVVHAVRSDPQNLTLINILRQKTTDDEVKRYAVRYMERCGSFQYSRDVLDLLRRRADEEVSELELRVSVGDADAARRGAESMRKILERLKVEQ